MPDALLRVGSELIRNDGDRIIRVPTSEDLCDCRRCGSTPVGESSVALTNSSSFVTEPGSSLFSTVTGSSGTPGSSTIFPTATVFLSDPQETDPFPCPSPYVPIEECCCGGLTQGREGNCGQNCCGRCCCCFTTNAHPGNNLASQCYALLRVRTYGCCQPSTSVTYFLRMLRSSCGHFKQYDPTANQFVNGVEVLLSNGPFDTCCFWRSTLTTSNPSGAIYAPCLALNTACRWVGGANPSFVSGEPDRCDSVQATYVGLCNEPPSGCGELQYVEYTWQVYNRAPGCVEGWAESDCPKETASGIFTCSII